VRALAGTLFVTAFLFSGSGLLSGAAQEEEPRAPLRLLDVPFISQSEALCGGAAAAMVLRYWGETGVQAEDFAALIDAHAAGITTSDLAAAMQARGATVAAANGSDSLAQAELASGRPPIALIEDRPGALHYVVLVGWHARAVVFHDPARTPFVVMRPDDFARRWRASGNWMLAVAPGSRTATSASLRPGDPGDRGRTAALTRPHPVPGG
jgi:ABC-type bacteriocin/lantibiotic exporter with double-glycine peptidase domain